MKRVIAICLMLIIMSFTCVYAVIYNTTEEHIFNDSLPYSDLQDYARDSRGVVKVNRQGQTLYTYNYAINEILKATSIGLIEGYKDGTFRPSASITRAEFIKLAISLAVNRNFDFEAIPTKFENWFGPYVAVAEMQNVIEENQYTEQQLNEPITRIEMICILSKIQINMKGISQYRDAELPNYIDIESLTEEEKELLLHAARYELIPGMFDTNELKPNDNLTRAEATRAIMRIY